MGDREREWEWEREWKSVGERKREIESERGGRERHTSTENLRNEARN